MTIYYKVMESTNKLSFSFDEVLSCVSRSLGVEEKDILSQSRKADIAEARHIFCYEAKRKVMVNKKKANLTEIGLFLNRNHATVINSLNKYKNYIEVDKQFRDKANRVKLVKYF